MLLLCFSACNHTTFLENTVEHSWKPEELRSACMQLALASGMKLDFLHQKKRLKHHQHNQTPQIVILAS